MSALRNNLLPRTRSVINCLISFLEKRPKLHKFVLGIAQGHDNLIGYRKYGLFRDDIISENDPVIEEALKRLSDKEAFDRTFRLRRAIQLNLNHDVLPPSEQTDPKEDLPYLWKHVEAICKERDEATAFDNAQPTGNKDFFKSPLMRRIPQHLVETSPMETDNPQLVVFLQDLRAKTGSTDGQAKIDDLIVYYQKKLWHQLTMTCEAIFFESTGLPKDLLIALFRGFIEKWSKKMNQLAFTKLAVRVAELLGNKDESIALLEGLADRIKKENLTDILPVSYILARIEASQYYLISSVPENVNRARDYIDECIELVETMPVSPPLAVQTSVYRISALFDKFSLNYSAFYRHSLLHLACLSQESLESSVEAEKRLEAAHDLCIAALLADDIFNFGELLENSILNSLKGTQFEFLLKLVSSFNSGDLSILAPSSNNSALNNHPALLAHVPFLQEKLCLMSLAQLLFTQLKTDRRVPFSTISHATKVPLDQVEFLLIRAISCKIIRGIIDQVDSSINVSWIQPRLLDQNQVGDLFSAINSWNKKVVHTLEIVQEMREKGAFSESTTTII